MEIDLRQILNPSANYVFEWDENFLAKHCVYGPGIVVTPEKLDTILLTSLGPPITLNAKTRIGYLSPVLEMYHLDPSPNINTDSKVNNRNTKMTKEQLGKIKIASDLTDQQQNYEIY